MQILLTERNDYLLNPNLNLCLSMEDLYRVVKEKDEDDNSLHIFVDNAFISTTNLKQLEMYDSLVEDFRLIVNKDLAYLLGLNKALNLYYYYLTEVTKTASDIYLKSYPFEMTEDLNDIKDNFNYIITNEKILQNMLDYDFVNLQNMFKSVSIILDRLEYSQNILTDNMEELLSENKLLKENLKLARERNKIIEDSREELLRSNLRLKYNGYIDEIGRPLSELSTPLLYIKAPLIVHDKEILKFFVLLKDFMLNKYGKNVCLVVLEDTNALKIKKTYSEFTYVNSRGQYNMDMGNQIITVPQFIYNLLNNFEQFAGIKDLFIILDLTPTPYIYAVGEGSIIYILNDRQSEEIRNFDVEGVVKVEEKHIKDTYVGEDEFNLEINISKSSVFQKLENIAISLIS